MNVRENTVLTGHRKTVAAFAGIMVLAVTVGVRYFHGRDGSAPAKVIVATAPVSQREFATPQSNVTEKTKRRPVARHATRKPTDDADSPAELIETQPVEARYDCDGDCPAGYDITNTTGSKTEARWLHAAGFPTVAEYKNLTENDAALAEAMRRSDAGDARAAAILGQYFLEQKDYVESSRQLARAELQCNVFAYRVNAQLYLDQPDTSFMLAAEDLRVAYLMGDQQAALELASLLEASNLTDSTRLGMIDQNALAMFGGILQVNRTHHYGGCRYHGVRPRPGMRNLE